MKSRSAKNKGKRLQNEVCELILQYYPELEPDDCRSTIMGESGTDVKLSPVARKKFPYSIECKNTEKLAIWAALAQAEANSTKNTTPLLIFRRNRTEAYVALPLDAFMKLQTRASYDEKCSNVDPNSTNGNGMQSENPSPNSDVGMDT